MRKTMTIAAAALVTAGAVATAGAAQASEGGTAVHFAPGATAAQVSGQLAAGGDRTYTFDARAGQTATVHVTHNSPTERWTLVGPTGTPLHTDHTAQQEAADDGTQVFPVDSAVEHTEWGPGMVMRHEDDRIVVLFEEVGYKTLALQAVLDHDLLRERAR